MELENHSNYNCLVIQDDGTESRVYANWLHNSGLDHWHGWICQAGADRLYIDENLDVWGGECKNDLLGSALEEFALLDHTRCRRNTCTGCTDDLIVAKRQSNHDQQ